MVSVQREVELKFAASDDFVLPGLSQSRRWAVAGPAGEVRLEAVYYDTDTLTLAREGILLRYSCRCRRRASSTSAMTCAGTRPKTGPMRSTVTERTCSA